MGKPTGFLEYPRQTPSKRPVEERVKDDAPVYLPLAEEEVNQQAARCMDCGVPTCMAGCPLGNIIPDWNDLVYQGKWREAYSRLRATNNFPEFTGRICPAPCESACVLGLIEEPVTIEQIEQEISERAYENGWVDDAPPQRRTGKKVAVVGSGPAGLAAADQLNTAGHTVVVFERHDRIGGLLRYGIPDFKLDKSVLDRSLETMRSRGVKFRTNAEVGGNVPASELDAFDAVVLCGGATKPRALPIPGHDLEGIYFAWDYLHRHNKLVAGDDFVDEGWPEIHADGCDVIVIGGGDTGSDCVGTANRQGAASVTQFELLPMPPDERPPDQPWPYMPMVLKTTSSHEEGADRHWRVMTKEFLEDDGHVTALRTVEVEVDKGEDGRLQFNDVPGSEHVWPADIVLLAIGYTGPETDGLLAQLDVALDQRQTVDTGDGYATSIPGVFAAGDLRRGQSLVVWAISEGREAARAVDEYLVGETSLPTRGEGALPRL